MTTKKDPELIVHIDGSALPLLKEDGKQLVFNGTAEEAIRKLLALEYQVQLAIDYVKREIEKAGLAVNPNFSSVQGDYIKVGYRAYGAKYYIDPANQDSIPEELLTIETKTITKLKSAKDIEKWAEEHGGKLPLGITQSERQKQISMKPIRDFGNES